MGVGALLSLSGIGREMGWGGLLFETGRLLTFYFGGARSKGFATLRNVSKLPFFDKIGHAKSVGFRFYSAI